VSSVFWYAPFDNAAEMALAEELARHTDLDLTVQSISERFGQPLTPRSHPDFTLVRDLPPPATERRGSNTVALRGWTAAERSIRRGRLVRRGHFDLLHLHTYNPITDWAAIPLLRRRTPIVVQSVHNVRPHDSVFPYRLETQLLGHGYRASSALVVAHDHLKRQLVEEFNVEPSRVATIPFPITLPVRPPGQARSTTRGRVTFLFFGTLRSNKGLLVLIEAIRDLDRQSGHASRIDFVLAGRGDPDLELAVRAAADELGNLTAEIGYVTNQRRQELYDQAHCVLLPYTSISAQSGVLYDAYSQRLPVIATKVGPIGETVREHRSGWVVKPNDRRALVDAILIASRSPLEMSDAADRGAAVAEHRTPRRTAEMLFDLYHRLLNPRVRCNHRSDLRQ
jgi:glycosyltransferase involved in cell wall biosynthesis